MVEDKRYVMVGLPVVSEETIRSAERTLKMLLDKNVFLEVDKRIRNENPKLWSYVENFVKIAEREGMKNQDSLLAYMTQVGFYMCYELLRRQVEADDLKKKFK